MVVYLAVIGGFCLGLACAPPLAIGGSDWLKNLKFALPAFYVPLIVGAACVLAATLQ